MPTRSNPFQKLVHHLRETLAQGFAVEESALLPDRADGEPCEVDIVIRGRVGGLDVIVSIECVDRTRPATKEWVREMIGKHQMLTTNKLVLVSRSGFTKGARARARASDIQLLTPTESFKCDWTRVVGKGPLFVARFGLKPVGSWLVIEINGTICEKPAGNDTELRKPDGTHATLETAVAQLLRRPDVGAAAMDKIERDGSKTMTIRWTPSSPLFAVDDQGGDHRVRGLRVTVEATRASSELSLRSFDFEGVPAAVATGQTVLGDTTLTIVEPAAGKFDGRVFVSGRRLELYPNPDATNVGESSPPLTD